MEREKEYYLYKVSVATQIGKKSGKLFLTVSDNKIDGFLDILGRKQPLSGEKTKDGCWLKGQLRTLISVFDYTAAGYFDNQSVSLDIVYKHGCFRLVGSCEDFVTDR